jgi:hypothetical protein
MTQPYRKNDAGFTPVQIVANAGPFMEGQTITMSNPIPVRLVTTESGAEYNQREATTDANPRPIAPVGEPNAFKPGLPISPQNPWPVKVVELDGAAYNAAKPVSDSNPLPVVARQAL